MSFANYVDKISAFFDHLSTSPPLTFSTYLMNVDEKSTFLTPTSPLLTFSILWTLTKRHHFLTTYPPPLVNVVWERPLNLFFSFVCFFESEFINIFLYSLDSTWKWKLNKYIFFPRPMHELFSGLCNTVCILQRWKP